MSAHWASLETQVVNGAFPLQRLIGCTDHSAVFLTQSTKHAPSAVALKLLRRDPGSAVTQLSRWQVAAGLSHPHLVKIFEAGECRVDEEDFLYARMEYADQTLAQVLERRALTEEEAREMLAPTLDALDYLHRNGLVHGGLKPSNVLVVGNQLKLASDAVRSAADADADDADGATIAADVHALGLTLCEALTRRRPIAADHAGTGDVALPPDLPVTFRPIVARCLRRDPGSRPTVAELQACLRGEQPAEVPDVAPVPAQAREFATARASASPLAERPAARLVVRVELPGNEPRRPTAAETSTWRVLPLSIGAVVLLALVWVGYRAMSGGADVPAPVRDEASPATASTTPPVGSPAAPPAAPTAAAPATPPPANEPATPPVPAGGVAVGEVLPNVSRSALDTIRGTLRVSVRVTVDGSGHVVDAMPDDPGPSRYFERRSVEAARQWTFPSAVTEAPRTMQVRFAFTRAGVTASSKPLP